MPRSASPTNRDGRPPGRATGRWRVALTAYWPLLFVATHLPADELIVGPLTYYDKPLHVGAFFVLTTLMLRAFRGGPKRGWGLSLGVAAVALAYAAADELTQPLVNRVCDPYDWLADAAGVALAVVVDRFRGAVGAGDQRERSMGGVSDADTAPPSRLG